MYMEQHLWQEIGRDYMEEPQSQPGLCDVCS